MTPQEVAQSLRRMAFLREEMQKAETAKHNAARERDELHSEYVQIWKSIEPFMAVR